MSPFGERTTLSTSWWPLPPIATAHSRGGPGGQLSPQPVVPTVVDALASDVEGEVVGPSVLSVPPLSSPQAVASASESSSAAPRQRPIEHVQ